MISERVLKPRDKVLTQILGNTVRRKKPGATGFRAPLLFPSL
jgi:hypothetical protein